MNVSGVINEMSSTALSHSLVGRKSQSFLGVLFVGVIAAL
jgi:hypothetical protein